MSTRPVVEADSETAIAQMAWIVGAVVVGLVTPWYLDRILSEVMAWPVPTPSQLAGWVVSVVLVCLLGLGCAWTVAIHTPFPGDRIMNLLLGVMVLSVTSYFFAAWVPRGGSMMGSGGIDVSAPMGLDRGLVASIGAIALGLPLAMLFWWRAARPSRDDDGSGRTGDPIRRGLALAGIVIVTTAAGYMAWAAHTEQVLRQ